MNLPEIYKCLEKELYNYCVVKNNQPLPRRRFRDSHNIYKESFKNSVQVELNFYGGERHLYGLSSPEKYFSIEIVTSTFQYHGDINIYSNFELTIFKCLMDKERQSLYRIDKIYPDREPFSMRELKEYVKFLGLIKKDLLELYHWIKCLSVSLV